MAGEGDDPWGSVTTAGGLRADEVISTLQKSIAMLREGAAGLSTAPELCAEIDAATSQLTRAAVLEAERDAELSAGRTSALPHAFG